MCIGMLASINAIIGNFIIRMKYMVSSNVNGRSLSIIALVVVLNNFGVIKLITYENV